MGIDNLNDYYDVRLKDYRLGQLLRDDFWRTSANPSCSVYSRNLQHDAFFFRAIDIENLAGLDLLFAEFQFSAVFNLAARAGVRYSLENPHVYMTTNAMGSLNLLECLRRYNVRKFILASTSSLYAGCPMPFNEQQPVNAPLSPYAASKKAAELLAFSYHHLYGISVTVARYFTVFGPASRPDMSILGFIRRIDAGTPIELFGDGDQSRDFTYVDDIARGTILAEQLPGYEIINLGGGYAPVTINQMIAMMQKLLGKTARINTRPASSADMRDTQADIAKAGRLLGWTPQTRFEDGLHRSVEWYLANREWLKDLKL